MGTPGTPGENQGPCDSPEKRQWLKRIPTSVCWAYPDLLAVECDSENIKNGGIPWGVTRTTES